MGKSTVLGMFRELGGVTLNADSIVDGLLHEERVILKLKALLGNDICLPDGALDRRMVASRLFSDRTLKDRVEEILHPLVFDEIDRFLNGVKQGEDDGKLVFIEIPLLFEKGYSGRFARTITVFTDEGVALERLERKGIGREDALMRLKAQMPIDEKIRKADFAIDNGGDTDATRRQVSQIYEKLMEIARKV